MGSLRRASLLPILLEDLDTLTAVYLEPWFTEYGLSRGPYTYLSIAVLPHLWLDASDNLMSSNCSQVMYGRSLISSHLMGSVH